MWSFEGVGRSVGELVERHLDAFHRVDAIERGPLEFAVRANDCDTVVSFLQEADRGVCRSEQPSPGAVPSGSAWEVNVLATEAVCRAATLESKRVVVLSTDELFDEANGPAAESTVPLTWPANTSWYGATWAEAEARISRMRGSIAVLRVSALFGWPAGPACDARLAGEWLKERPGGPELVQPTLVPDALRALTRLVDEPLSGRFHASLTAPIGRKVLAEALARSAGVVEPPPNHVPERHPGLVSGRLQELGLKMATPTAALDWLGRRPRD